MEKKENASSFMNGKGFKIVVGFLAAAIIVTGALFAAKAFDVVGAANPQSASIEEQAKSGNFEIDPDNPPEGVTITRDADAQAAGSAADGSQAAGSAASSEAGSASSASQAAGTGTSN